MRSAMRPVGAHRRFIEHLKRFATPDQMGGLSSRLPPRPQPHGPPPLGGRFRQAFTLGLSTVQRGPPSGGGPGWPRPGHSACGRAPRPARAFASPFNPAADNHSPCMTAFPQSSPPGPEPLRFPETFRRRVSGPRKRSSHPTPPRPKASAADVRPSSAQQCPVSGAANANAARGFACPDLLVVCTGVRTPCMQVPGPYPRRIRD